MGDNYLCGTGSSSTLCDLTHSSSFPLRYIKIVVEISFIFDHIKVK